MKTTVFSGPACCASTPLWGNAVEKVLPPPNTGSYVQSVRCQHADLSQKVPALDLGLGSRISRREACKVQPPGRQKPPCYQKAAVFSHHAETSFGSPV